jgi:hypothetical protein
VRLEQAQIGRNDVPDLQQADISDHQPRSRDLRRDAVAHDRGASTGAFAQRRERLFAAGLVEDAEPDAREHDREDDRAVDVLADPDRDEGRDDEQPEERATQLRHDDGRERARAGGELVRTVSFEPGGSVRPREPLQRRERSHARRLDRGSGVRCSSRRRLCNPESTINASTTRPSRVCARSGDVVIWRMPRQDESVCPCGRPVAGERRGSSAVRSSRSDHRASGPRRHRGVHRSPRGELRSNGSSAVENHRSSCGISPIAAARRSENVGVMKSTESAPVGIDTRRRYELQRLMDEVLRAGRTVRSETRLERARRSRELVGNVQMQLEAHGVNDEPGLEAVQAWLQALRETDPGDVDRLQELLYGLDALVRTHIWRETGFPLEPPPATALGF